MILVKQVWEPSGRPTSQFLCRYRTQNHPDEGNAYLYLSNRRYCIFPIYFHLWWVTKGRCYEMWEKEFWEGNSLRIATANRLSIETRKTVENWLHSECSIDCSLMMMMYHQYCALRYLPVGSHRMFEEAIPCVLGTQREWAYKQAERRRTEPRTSVLLKKRYKKDEILARSRL
jgi:hypothetical protein